MATYKTPRDYLNKAVSSILNQNYRNFEFIIVCDGDKEEYEYIKSYKDDRIKLILHNQNMGLANSLNDGINVATGKYIIRMDSDDICLKNRIKKQVDYMEKNNDIIVNYMQALCFGKENEIKYTFNSKPSEINIQLFYMNCIVHPAVIIRKKFLEEKNIKYNDRYICSQDYELWTKICNFSNISEIHEIGILYRTHDKQVSNQKREIQEKLKENIIKQNSIKKLGLNNSEIINTLMILSGSRKLTKENYKTVIENINNIIEQVKNPYEKKKMRKVFYNRVFQIIVSNKKEKYSFISYIKKMNMLKTIIQYNNVCYIVSRIFMKLKSKLIKNILYKKYEVI